MRIVQFVHGYPPEFVAGTERYTQALSRSLVMRGHACLVVAGSDQGSSRPSITVEEDHGVQVVRLIGLFRCHGFRASIGDPEAEAMIRWVLALWKPDVIHLQHWVRLTNHLVTVAKEWNLPTVITLHDQWIGCTRFHRIQPNQQFCVDPVAPCASCVDRDPWQRGWEIEQELVLRQRTLERELRLADRLLVPSEAQRDFLQQIVPTIPDGLEVIPLGSPVERKKLIDPRENGFSDGPLKVGHWGYLAPAKGVHLLLEAAQLLPPDQEIEWHLYGLPADHSYEERLDRLSVGRSVFFHGRYIYEDLRSGVLDVAAFPSLCHETYSFVIDEAFALGLPVVVPNRGAFPERIGEAGLMFQWGDPGDLAKKIAWLQENPTELARLKRAIPTGKVLPMEDHVRRLEEIYQEVKECHANKPVHDPDRGDRELLHHLYRVVEDRDREIRSLRGQMAEQEGAIRELEDRLHQSERTAMDKETLLQQARQALDALQGDHANLRAYLLNLQRTPLFRFLELLKRLSGRQ